MTVLCLIVARASNGVIGARGTMPWHIPADLKFFRKTTTGHPVIMGWKTWESIGRPLPGRRNIVLSRSRAEPPAGAEIAASLGDALGRLGQEERAFVIGGAHTYREALPLVSEAYITEIDQAFEGDTYFTVTDRENWEITELGRFEDGGCTGRFTKWTRRQPPQECTS